MPGRSYTERPAPRTPALFTFPGPSLASRVVLSRESLLSASKRGAKALVAAGPAALLALVVMLALVGGGLFLRARGYLWGGSSFWLDECMWAMNLTTRGLLENQIRPPGFIVVSRWLALALGPTEPVLRALPWLAAVLSTVAAPFLAARLYTSTASRLLFVAAVAFNACTIDFAKEFKPYSLGFLLHVALVLAVLRYVESQRGRALAGALTLASVAVLFSQDLVFAYPGVFLVLGSEAFFKRREHLRFIVAAAGVIILALVAQYLLLWRHMPKGGHNYWGAKYNIFYTDQQSGGYLAWLWDRYRDMTGFPGVRRDHWDGWTHDARVRWRGIDRSIWLALHFAGLAVMAWKRAWRFALLLALPLLLVCIFNALKVWPVGPFRSNIFTIFYFSAIAAMAFEGWMPRGARFYSALPALAIVILPLFVFERVWHKRKQYLTYDSRFQEIVTRLATQRRLGDGEKEPLILDRRSCDPYRFYTEFHPKTRKLKAVLERRYVSRCLKEETEIPGALLESASPQRPEWIVLHTGHTIDRVLKRRSMRVLRTVKRSDIGPHTLLGITRVGTDAGSDADADTDMNPSTDADTNAED